MVRFVWSPDNHQELANTAARLSAHPPGRKGLIVINESSYNLLRRNSAHACIDPVTGAPYPTPYLCPWLEEGAAATQSQYQTFFSTLGSLGVQLDVMTVNYEMATFDYWGGPEYWGMANDPLRYSRIQNDPRFFLDDTRYPVGDVRRRSIPSQLGFSDLSLVLNWQAGSTQRPYYAIWNSLMYDRIAAYMNDSIYAPARQYFPNIKFSDNPFHIQDPSFNVPETTGAVHSYCESPYYCSPRRHVGSHQNPTIGYEPLLISAFTQGAVLFDGVRPYHSNYFNTARLIANKYRSMYLSAPDTPISPTIGCKSFAWRNEHLNNPYYQEQLMHAALTGVEFFFLWNPHHPYWTDVVNDCPLFDSDNEIVNRVLSEFNALAGAQGRVTLVTDLADWYSDWLLTGMRAGGRKVWRFTPLEYEATVQRAAIGAADTLVSTNPLVFQTLQNRIEFPFGTIHTPENPSSSKGFWIVQPSDAPDPIITQEAVNSPPILSVTVSPLQTLPQFSGPVRYVDGTGSYDEDGSIASWYWDTNNDGIQQYHETVINGANLPNFWTDEIPAGVTSLRLRATDNQGAVSEIVVPVP